MPYLKPSDLPEPVKFKLLSVPTATVERRKKDGGMYEVYEFIFKNRATGQTLTTDIFPKPAGFKVNGKSLLDSEDGDIWEAYANGDFVNFRPVEESTNNAKDVKAEKRFGEHITEQARNIKAKDIAIAVQGVGQIALVHLLKENPDAPIDHVIEEALDIGFKFRSRLRERVASELTKNDL